MINRQSFFLVRRPKNADQSPVQTITGLSLEIYMDNPVRRNKGTIAKLAAPFAMSVPLLFASACDAIFAPSVEPIVSLRLNHLEKQRTETIIEAPFSQVWPTIVFEIGKNYSFQTMDKESGILVTQPFQISRDEYLKYTMDGQRSLAFDNAFESEYPKAYQAAYQKYEQQISQYAENQKWPQEKLDSAKQSESRRQTYLKHSVRQKALQNMDIREPNEWPSATIRFIQVLAVQTGRNRTSISIKINIPPLPQPQTEPAPATPSGPKQPAEMRQGNRPKPHELPQIESSGVLENSILTAIERAFR